MIKIALDAFGGDNGPEVLVAGGIKSLGQIKGKLLLVGDKTRLEEILSKIPHDSSRIELIDAPDVVDMHMKPKESLKLRNSSISVAVDLVKKGEADAVVSAGNTGATAAACRIKLRTLEGIQAPAISTFFPTYKDLCFILDVGASVDCKPHHFLQFGMMGAVYSQEVLGHQNPRVGLLSIGEEETKGNEQTLKAHQIMKESNLNFVGNAEGGDILSGDFDVIVMDGFVGNIVLKLSSSIPKFLKSLVTDEIKKGPITMLGGLLSIPAYKRVAGRVDKREWGGAPLLGVNGNCIIAHGSSDEKAISNAIKRAEEMVTQDVNKKILEMIVNSENKIPVEEVV